MLAVVSRRGFQTVRRTCVDETAGLLFLLKGNSEGGFQNDVEALKRQWEILIVQQEAETQDFKDDISNIV